MTLPQLKILSYDAEILPSYHPRGEKWRKPTTCVVSKLTRIKISKQILLLYFFYKHLLSVRIHEKIQFDLLIPQTRSSCLPLWRKFLEGSTNYKSCIYSANTGATGLNPIEVPKLFIFGGLLRNYLNCDTTAIVTFHFICISAVFNSFHSTSNTVIMSSICNKITPKATRH